jgi:hypothetical protein
MVVNREKEYGFLVSNSQSPAFARSGEYNMVKNMGGITGF